MKKQTKQFHLNKQQAREIIWSKLQKKLKLTGSEGVDKLLTRNSV